MSAENMRGRGGVNEAALYIQAARLMVASGETTMPDEIVDQTSGTLYRKEVGKTWQAVENTIEEDK